MRQKLLTIQYNSHCVTTTKHWLRAVLKELVSSVEWMQFNTYCMETYVLLHFEHKNNVPSIVTLLYRATSRKSQIIKLKMYFCSILIICSNDVRLKVMSCDKIGDLPCISSCGSTSFECLRHIHLSLGQGTTDQGMTSKSSPLSYFEQSSNWYFSIHSL